jgi:hypothetical protein
VLSNFVSDLGAAELTEDYFADMLMKCVRDASHVAKVPTDIREKYDRRITVGKGPLSIFYLIEVKDDLKSEETGNFVVEKAREPRDGGYVPSGINVTTADYWAYKARVNGKEGFYIIPTIILRNFILNEKKRLVWGGDDNRTHMYLFKVDLLVAHGLQLDLAEDDSVLLRKHDASEAIHPLQR